jgi:hypothetical protein
MDAGAAPNAVSGSSAPGGGDGSTASDPLQRLEAELEATGAEHSTDRGQLDGGQPDGTQLYDEAHRLLEEAWSIFTECQVMRDGLLAACQEIERTMDSVQQRLGAPVTTESNGHGHLSNGNGNGNGKGNGAMTVSAGLNGAAHGSHGSDADSNGADASSNGAHASSNGAHASSNGAHASSNGAGPH